MKELEDFIKRTYPISDKAREALQDICTEVHFKKNDIISNVGGTCKTIYFVKKGALRIFYFKGDNDITDSMEFENAFVARVESLVSGQPSRKGIQAIEDTEMLAKASRQKLKVQEFPSLSSPVERHCERRGSSPQVHWRYFLRLRP